MCGIAAGTWAEDRATLASDPSAGPGAAYQRGRHGDVLAPPPLGHHMRPQSDKRSGSGTSCIRLDTRFSSCSLLT
jgi:hypothetical protein